MPTPGSSSWQAAQAALARRDFALARRHLHATLRAQPRHCHARVLLAGVVLAGGQLRDACTQLLRASQELPDDATMVCRVAQGLLRVGETVAARACLAHPSVAACRDGSTLASIAHLHQMLGEHVEALAMMDRARGHGFDNADFRYFRSIQLQFNGRLDEAEQELEACLRLGPTYGRASLTLARLRRQTPQTQHLHYIRAQLLRVRPGSEDHAAFEFAQYKELEDLGDLASAWSALARANAIMHQRLAPPDEGALYDGLMALATRAFVSDAPRTQLDGPMPIFIVGMPRSGTTVLDRILGNHPAVRSAGELADFGHQLRWAADRSGRKLLDEALLAALPDIDFAQVGRRYLQQTQWRAAGARFYVDKLPANFLLLGLIAKALPGAVFLHSARDAMDLCFSNFRALFGAAYAYSYELDALATHHRMYRRLMAHWHDVLPGRILDVDYAALVNAPEATAREVFAFCGLEFAAGCSDIARNAAPVATLSSAQVREGIHTRGIGEWRRYEHQLLPLQRGLSP